MGEVRSGNARTYTSSSSKRSDALPGTSISLGATRSGLRVLTLFAACKREECQSQPVLSPLDKMALTA
jgi:hypothetical protein